MLILLSLTRRGAIFDQELQHVVHGTHEEDQSMLGHYHGYETPHMFTKRQRDRNCVKARCALSLKIKPHFNGLLKAHFHGKFPECTII